MKRQIYLLFPIQAGSVLLFLLLLLIQIANPQYTIFAYEYPPRFINNLVNNSRFIFPNRIISIWENQYGSAACRNDIPNYTFPPISSNALTGLAGFMTRLMRSTTKTLTCRPLCRKIDSRHYAIMQKRCVEDGKQRKNHG